MSYTQGLIIIGLLFYITANTAKLVKDEGWQLPKIFAIITFAIVGYRIGQGDF